MYYQVVIEATEKVGKVGRNKQYFELDKTNLSEIEERVVKPFLRKEDFQFNGYFLKYSEIRRIAVKETSNTAQALSDYENRQMPSGVIMFVSSNDIVSYERHAKDITTAVFDKAKESLDVLKQTTKIATLLSHESKAVSIDPSKIFIVHGRDDFAKVATARFVEKIGFSAIILHEQASAGKTIIEKIEEHTNVGFAIVLYTPCDFGGLAGQRKFMPRARQNVVFEHGYLIAKLGRQNVCALVKGDTEMPNDISGIVYIPFDDHGAWQTAVAKEMRKAGCAIDMNKVV